METTQQHIRSRRKHSHGEHNPAPIDRLSSLPDSILCHILSFLPTKFSIRTCVLSKRWRNLWAYVPNLDFELENQYIINRVLLQHQAQTIDNFYLIHKNDRFLLNKNECTDYQLETWIIFATVRNVKNLHLCFFSSMMLPRRLFTCKTLVSLKLDDCGVVPNIGSAVCLPRLKKLHLTCVRYEGDGSLSNLLSGSPVLEELVMELIMDLVSCNISSPTIKRLTLDFRTDGLISDYYDYINDYWLEINVPSLTYLKMIHCFSEDIKCGMLNSLTEADIDIYNYNDFLYSRSEVELIDRLCNIKFLNLDLRHCTGIIDSTLSAWTISFRNLTKLELTADCRFLSKFLETADNLEILIFSEFRQEIEGWMEPQQVPTCLLSNLRFIKLVNIEGKHHEYEYVQYLLRNAQVLERMEISHIRFISCEKKLYMLQQISLFRRASSACEIAFALDDA